MNNLKKLFKAMLLIVLFVIIAGFYNYISGFKRSERFAIKKIILNGVVNADISKLDAECKKFAGINIFSVNADVEKIAADKWIKRISLKKVYPDGLEFNIYEKKALLKVKDGNRCYYYTEEEEKVYDKGCEQTKVTANADLSLQKIKEAAEILDNSEMRDIDTAYLEKSYIKIYKKGREYKVGYDAKVFKGNYLYVKAIETSYKRIEYIDMRVPMKIFISGVRNDT